MFIKCLFSTRGVFEMTKKIFTDESGQKYEAVSGKVIDSGDIRLIKPIKQDKQTHRLILKACEALNEDN